MRIKNRRVNITDYDWVSIILFVGLVIIGILSIYSTEYNNLKTHFINNFYSKQILWASISMLIIIAIGFVSIKKIKNLSSIIYLAGLLSLILVLIFGANINGNKSWFRFGNFSIQPAEFVKVTTVLGLASLLSDIDFKINRLKDFAKATLLIFAPVLLILMQPDLGSAIVFLSLFLVLYREGIDLKYYIIIFYLTSLFILTIYWGKNNILIIFTLLYINLNLIYYFKFKKTLLLKTSIFLAITYLTIFSTDIIFRKVLKPHQRNRIEIVLGKKKDDRGTGYNLKQALIAIGSGGLTGKGLNMSTQTKGYFIPEQHTDWIFTVIGERWGFVGGILLITLYLALLYRILFLAERQKQKFSRIVGYGLLSILFIHFSLNLLMVLGIFPTIGIPLPFISYGGSSLWAFTILLFLFLKFDAHRKEDW